MQTTTDLFNKKEALNPELEACFDKDGSIPYSLGEAMTKAQCRSIIQLTCSQFLHNNPMFNSSRLYGRNHIDRSVIAHAGLSRLIPERYLIYMSFGGDRLAVIPAELAKMIGKELGIPYDFFSSQMRDFRV